MITETIQIFINTPFFTNSLTMTRTEVITDSFVTVGHLDLTNTHDPVLMLGLFALFLFVGTAIGKPTLFIIAYFGLVLVGVLPQSGAWVATGLTLLLGASAFYHWLTLGAQS